MTHYTAGHHDDVARVLEAEPVDFVQINYSVAEREADRTILPLAADAGHCGHREPTVRWRERVRQAERQSPYLAWRPTSAAPRGRSCC